jgi:hypothetical protein
MLNIIPHMRFVGLCPPPWFHDLGIFPILRAVCNFILWLRRHLSKRLQGCWCQRYRARQHHLYSSRFHLWRHQDLLRRTIQLPMDLNLVPDMNVYNPSHNLSSDTPEVFDFSQRCCGSSPFCSRLYLRARSLTYFDDDFLHDLTIHCVLVPPCR